MNKDDQRLHRYILEMQDLTSVIAEINNQEAETFILNSVSYYTNKIYTENEKEFVSQLINGIEKHLDIKLTSETERNYLEGPSRKTSYYTVKDKNGNLCNIIKLQNDVSISEEVLRYTIDINGKRNENIEKVVVNTISNFNDKKKDNKQTVISMLSPVNNTYLTTNDFRLNNIKIKDLDINYKKGFSKINDLIKSKIDDKNKSGLIILNGEAGTGKSSYCQYLLQELEDCKLCVMSPSVAIHYMTISALRGVMDSNNSNMVLLIEDGDDLIRSRDKGVSYLEDLLQATDGLIGSLIKIKVIITTNLMDKDIDDAIKRKGRLLYYHSFGKLSYEEAAELAKSINVNVDLIKDKNKKYTLSEIYNISDDNGIEDNSKSIGFR